MNLDVEMFRQMFFEEAADLLAEFEDSLLKLDETPDDKEVLNTVFRCAHSLKGGSATFGLAGVAHFTHSLETLLDQIRSGMIALDSALLQLLLEALDHLKELVAAAQSGAGDDPDSVPLITRIEAISDSVRCDTADCDIALLRVSVRFYPGSDVMRSGTDPLLLVSRMLEGGSPVSIECDEARLPALAELDPLACYLGWEMEILTGWEVSQFEEVLEFVADESEIDIHSVDAFDEAFGGFTPDNPVVEAESEMRDGAEEASPDTAAGGQEEVVERRQGPDRRQSPDRRQPPAIPVEAQTFRVSTDKVDKLINLVGELVINQSILNEVTQDFSMENLPRLIEAVADMDRASRELQERVMAVRMLPIKHAFGRFPRLVRDLAAACGKRIELRTTGEETELDKTLIESLADPLTHLVRNSVDHGLEAPEQRRAAGKSETGILSLNAFHEGGNIVIEVCDDGQGLNKERILRKAIERGLISESDPVPSDETVYNYIFHPGFSTAEKVTDLSGRGVGMDIVRKAVQKLGGNITLASTPGKGTRFRVRLPLTMAILEGLSVSVGTEVYILPLTSIVESIRPKPGDVRMIAGQMEVAVVRGEVLPTLRLYEVFGATPFLTDPSQALFVIVENDGQKVALLVDELIGQSQVVIKSLEANYRKVDGIAGATILGDGRVALILDVPGLIHIASPQSSFAAAA